MALDPVKGAKGFLDKVAEKAGSAFKTTKDSSIGKGFISAVKNVTGLDLENLDGSNPDGVHSGSKGPAKPVATNKKSGAVDGANTIKTDNPFTVKSGTPGKSTYYNDHVDSEIYISTSPTSKGKRFDVGKKPYSAFNKYSLINYRGTPLDISKNGFDPTNEQGLLQYQKIDIQTLQNPTVTQIIERTSAISGGADAAGNIDSYAYRYQYSDFALAKYYNKIPNNMLITLRRFAYPAADDIITPKGLDKDGKTQVSIQQPDIARAVTWLGEAPGNAIGDIIKFKNGFGWDEAESAVQDKPSKQQAASGSFGNMVQNNMILSAMANAGAGRDAVAANANKQNAGYDSFKETYPNHIFGPLNVIKKVLVRKQGLEFDQTFTLKFEYELRAFEGANPKVMMMDQLANILALTYNNAPFWGGSVRYISDGAVAHPLGDLQKLREGDYLGFAGSIADDMGKMFAGVGKGIGGAAGALMRGDFTAALGALKDNKFLNNLIGGAAMEMFNTPQGSNAVASLLTGDPTGQWHLTVGNPLNPIMVIGNLCLQDCEITFEGGMGIQDFPEHMTAVITLKPGRPRDKAEIESMFNAGRGRFYVQPDDGADINKTIDVSAYGNKDRKDKKSDMFVNNFRKLSNG
jgi:hypothetical protein